MNGLVIFLDYKSCHHNKENFNSVALKNAQIIWPNIFLKMQKIYCHLWAISLCTHVEICFRYFQCIANVFTNPSSIFAEWNVSFITTLTGMVNAKMIICQMRFHSSAGQQGVYILTVISWVWKLPNLIDSYYLGLQWINVDTKDLQVIGNSVKMNDEVLITENFLQLLFQIVS